MLFSQRLSAALGAFLGSALRGALVAGLAVGNLAPVTLAKAAETSTEPPVVLEGGPLSAAELEELVAPVALYPDELLAITLPAATYPLQIVQAARLLEKLESEPDLTPDEDWDESVIGLMNYPEVIDLMNEDLDWTWKLGEAVADQQEDVMDAVQSFRARVDEAGNLESNEKVSVMKETEESQQIIVIESASPEVIYVPTYQPSAVVVYQPTPYPYYWSSPYPYYYRPGHHPAQHGEPTRRRTDGNATQHGQPAQRRRRTEGNEAERGQPSQRGTGGRPSQHRKLPEVESHQLRLQAVQREERDPLARPAGQLAGQLQQRLPISVLRLAGLLEPRWRPRRWWRQAALMRHSRAKATGLLATWLLAGVACSQPDPMAQRTFDSPDVAAEALMRAVGDDDVEAVVSILGPMFRDEIVTPDWAAGRDARQEIAAAARERITFGELADGALELVVGAQEWPLPIPLVQDEEGAWIFDTAEGLEVILDRRVGRNELTAIAIANAYVDAQIEYAKADRDGDDVLEYAQRLASTSGQRDGLYWDTAEDEEPSPLGPLVEGAESYLETLQPGDPIRGYYFRVLDEQGENPPGGAYDYVINGNMIAGFALVAYPADYGRSGVMTFVVNHRGVIQQKDLGPFTGMDQYDPDDTWAEVDARLEP